MAINKIDQPGSTAPTDNSDYTQQNLINVGGYMIGPAILTNWNDTSAEPDIKNGTYIQYAGNIYQVQGGDENIGGTIQEGLNYVIITTPDAGDTLTAAWGNDLTSYVYNEAYQGMYNTGALALQCVCKKASTVYTRGLFHNTSLTGAIFYAGSNTEIQGNLTITGDIIGDLTGDVTGNVTGKSDEAYEADFIPYTTNGGFTLAAGGSKNIYSDLGQGVYSIRVAGTNRDLNMVTFFASSSTTTFYNDTVGSISYVYEKFGG